MGPQLAQVADQVPRFLPNTPSKTAKLGALFLTVTIVVNVSASAQDLKRYNSEPGLAGSVTDIRWFSDGESDSPTTPTAGVAAPLDRAQAARFRQAVQRINHVIRQNPCHDFLKARLWPGITMDVTRTLASHRAFSGPHSYNLRVMDSGIFPDGEVLRVSRAARSKDPIVARAAEYELNRTVAQLFEDRSGRHGRVLYAVVASYRGYSNSAFYQKIDPVTMLHEMLHIITGMGDDDLAKRLGIDITEFNRDYELSSTAITAKLKKYACE